MPSKTLRKGRRNARQTRRVGGVLGQAGKLLGATALGALAVAQGARGPNSTALATFQQPSTSVALPYLPTSYIGNSFTSTYPPTSPVTYSTNYTGTSIVKPPAARVDVTKYDENGNGPEWVPSTLHGQPVPKILEGRFTQPLGEEAVHKPGNLFPSNAYAVKAWNKPGPDYKPGWFDPAPGDRSISEPEVQTWMPYVTGNPDEIVDYFEGYTDADKATLIDKYYTSKGLSVPEKTERRFTPMYIFATIMAIDLPEHRPDQQILSDARYEYWAERCKAGGMVSIPAKDPRNKAPGERPSIGKYFPEFFDKKTHLIQLVSHGRAPSDFGKTINHRTINSTTMRKGFAPLPEEIWWTRS